MIGRSTRKGFSFGLKSGWGLEDGLEHLGGSSLWIEGRLKKERGEEG